MPQSSPDGWTQHGGDVRACIEALANAQRAGALLRVEIEPRSLQARRDEGLAREREEDLLRKARETTVATLPPDAVGRRTLWSQFHFVLEGMQASLAPLGEQLLGALKRENDVGQFDWHLVFIEIFIAEPERTLRCDPGYSLATAEGRSAIAWVQPDPGADWKEPERYPTVVFLPVTGL